MAIKNEFSWLIWAKKISFAVLYALITGILFLWTDKVSAFGLLPILVGLQNFLKHKVGWNWL